MQTLILDNAQTAIKIIVLKGYLNRTPLREIVKQIESVVMKANVRLTTTRLKNIANTALVDYAIACHTFLINSFGANGQTVLQLFNKALAAGQTTYTTRAMGIPTQKYSKTYMSEVRCKLDKFLKIQALDPNSRSSLRSKAEREVRFECNQNMVKELMLAGTTLVVCSTHGDCSDRCLPWQGKIFSLDGTSGIVDSKVYVPLEVATDIFQTTKNGSVYKNGLLGFNCRHKLIAYVAGMIVPTVSKEEQQHAKSINAKQREYERKIRNFKERALALNAVGDREGSLKQRAGAIKLNKQYKQFSEHNLRAYYPDRVKIF